MKTLFTTVVGSHIWKMDHENSDLDLYVCRVTPREQVLRGKYVNKSPFEENEHDDPVIFNLINIEDLNTHRYDLTTITVNKVDIHYYNAQKVAEELIKMNLNHLIGVMSPCTINISDSVDVIYNLRYIVRECLSKKCYYSINGMVKHNIKKYIVPNGERNTNRRRRKIYRVIRFGINLLKHKKFIFRPSPPTVTQELLLDEWKNLKIAYDKSSLPETTQEKPFRDWLLRVRNTWG